MDRVRLGRVLGRGTRMAAKTLYEAVDAATSTPAAGSTSQSTPPRSSTPTPITERPRRTGPGSRPSTARQAAPPRPSMFAPVKRASRAVSLELTGSFFALFAFAFAVAGWHARSSLSGGDERTRFLIYCAVTAIFAYFSISNFLRARK